MTEISHIYGLSMTDDSLLKLIGSFVRHNRLKKNITQQKLSSDANISRSTLSLLEKGETVTVATLIRVLRVLDLLHIITDSFQIRTEVSPVEYAKMKSKTRKRARNNDLDIAAEPDLEW